MLEFNIKITESSDPTCSELPIKAPPLNEVSTCVKFRKSKQFAKATF